MKQNVFINISQLFLKWLQNCDLCHINDNLSNPNVCVGESVIHCLDLIVPTNNSLGVSNSLIIH